MTRKFVLGIFFLLVLPLAAQNGALLLRSKHLPIMEVGPTRNGGFGNLPRDPSYDEELIDLGDLNQQYGEAKSIAAKRPDLKALDADVAAWFQNYQAAGGKK